MDDDAWQSDEARIFWRYISSSLGRLVEVTAGLDDDGLNWRPPVAASNCVGAIALHMLANAEENILGVLAGQAVHRVAEAEFAGLVSHGVVLERWAGLEPRLGGALQGLENEVLRGYVDHPRRGRIRGLEVLIVVARHAAEHLGQAELTRDLWLASRHEAPFP